jgi:hypothetical protein
MKEFNPWKIRKREIEKASQKRQRELERIDAQREKILTKKQLVCRIIKKDGTIVQV